MTGAVMNNVPSVTGTSIELSADNEDKVVAGTVVTGKFEWEGPATGEAASESEMQEHGASMASFTIISI